MPLLASKELCLAAAWGLDSPPCSFSCGTFFYSTALVGIFFPEISNLLAQGSLPSSECQQSFSDSAAPSMHSRQRK